MIHSMTAFARMQSQGEWGNLTCEMRSINHRYLEISLHLPEILRVLEMPIREKIRQMVKRGKIECSIRLQTNNGKQDGVVVNKDIAKALCEASETIAAMLRQPEPISATDILRFPGVLETKEADLTLLQPEVMNLLEMTVTELMNARAREGKELTQLFSQRMDLMLQELAKIRERLPQIQHEQQERLRKRFHDAKVELDSTRLEQEMVIFAQRMDVAEEIERTETHLTEIRRILREGGAVGRRLDFLMQELNREANTLGSKSTDSTVTHAAVEMKVLIEQVREQVQNVE